MKTKRFMLVLGMALCLGTSPLYAQAPGSSLVGKLEGPTIITDISAYPTAFKESPLVAAQVKAGKLPPVEKRLPLRTDLMVLKPVHEIGRYGGTWHGLFNGPRDQDAIARVAATDKPLFF